MKLDSSRSRLPVPLGCLQGAFYQRALRFRPWSDRTGGRPKGGPVPDDDIVVDLQETGRCPAISLRPFQGQINLFGEHDLIERDVPISRWTRIGAFGFWQVIHSTQVVPG